MKTSDSGREAMFQAKPHPTSDSGREAMFIQNFQMVLDTRQAKPHPTSDSGREAMSLFTNRWSHLLASFFFALVLGSLLWGCSMSPQYAYAVKTADYGQCRSLEKGEQIRYKKQPVSFICEAGHVLYGKPYRSGDAWYFKSGRYEDGKIKEAAPTQVKKTLRNICQLQGSYGTGTQKIRKFYFNTKLQQCMPFEWSGKEGMAPFDSQDICEMNCYY